MDKFLTVDLDEIKWDFSFPCPGCEEAIFPLDNSGEYYSLLGIRIEERVLEEIIIQCTRCGAIICLKGFEMLNIVGSSSASFTKDLTTPSDAVRSGVVDPELIKK